MFKLRNNKIFMVISLFLLLYTEAFSTVYYISNNGDDNNSGTSQTSSWETLNKANNFVFQPGDSVLFKRGDVWRGQLIPQSGDSLNFIYYGAYGTGEKPLFLGSVNLSDSSLWTNTGNNIWQTAPVTTTGIEKIQNPSFSVNADGWILYGQNGANVTGSRDDIEYASAPASYKIECTNSGTNFYDVQFNNQGIPFSISAGKTYRLTFKAKSSIPFQPNYVYIMQSVSPYSGYSYFSSTTPFFPVIDTIWNTYNIFLNATDTASDAMLNFMFGDSLPDNSVLNIDDISLQEVVFNSEITNDVGNLIFNNESDFGEKKWNLIDVTSQGDFWFDADNYCLKMYSSDNPGLTYSEIECALTKNIIEISNTKYAIFENLHLKYGSGHAIGGANTQNIIIKSCDISYIGGGALYTTQYGWVRYGNGIEFWGNAQNNLVEQCRIQQIYDAAITNQNRGNTATQSDITYRNNLISNAEWSFEYWNRPSNSITQNIFFINNTCLYAGITWAHAQRPDKRGRHLNFFQNDAATSNFNVLNNIFYEATSSGLYVLRDIDLNSFNLDYNCWCQSINDTLIGIWYGESLINAYTMSQFSSYQNDYNKGLNSIAQYPVFADTATENFKLLSNSPCIDAGIPDTSGIPIGVNDFEGNIRIQDGNGDLLSVIDIGCYEYDYYTKTTDNEIFNNIIVYPNPSENYIIIELTNYNHEQYTIKIYNETGQLIKEIKYTNTKNIKINIQNFSPGIYYLHILNQEQTIATKKLIITK